MQSVTDAEFKKNVAHFIDAAARWENPLNIVRDGGEHLLLIRKSDLEGWQETHYLRNLPGFAEMLNNSLSEETEEVDWKKLLNIK